MSTCHDSPQPITRHFKQALLTTAMICSPKVWVHAALLMSHVVWSMYDSYTSTVGQYRTYPLGFTHNGLCGSRRPGALLVSLIGDAPAPLATTSHALCMVGAGDRDRVHWAYSEVHEENEERASVARDAAQLARLIQMVRFKEGDL